MKIDLKSFKFDALFLDKNEINNDDCFLLDEDGTIFIKGACDIYAFELNRQFDEYDVYIAVCNITNGIHYFCKKKDKYIDAQGIFNSLDELLENVPYFVNSDYIYKKLNNYKPDFNYEYINSLINFAKEIIKKYEYLYSSI